MDVFGVAVSEAGDFLRAAAVDAAHELGVFGALAEPRTIDELAGTLGIGGGRRRVRRLLDVLVVMELVVRARDRYVAVRVPPRGAPVARAGWGLLADVIKSDMPLPGHDSDTQRRMHEHLARAGAAAAAELAAMLDDVLRTDAHGMSSGTTRPDEGAGGESSGSVSGTSRPDAGACGISSGSVADTSRPDVGAGGESSRSVSDEPRPDGGARGESSASVSDESRPDGGARGESSASVPDETRLDDGARRVLLDLGGGAGAYTRAWLEAHPHARATLVDYPDVVAQAREYLRPFGDRARLVADDIRAALLDDVHDIALLANVLHLHDESICAALIESAAKAVRPGGVVVVKDLRMDEGRAGPLEGLVFALNMAVYTDGGDVYEGSRIRSWMAAAGLVDLEERRLDIAPDAIVVIGRKPVEDALARDLDSELSRMGKLVWRELEAAGELRTDAQPRRLEFPAPLRRMLSRALAVSEGESAAAIRRHYTELMPRLRVAQIVGRAEPAATLMHAPLDWARLPRLSAAIDELFALLAEADVEPVLPLGAESAAVFRARTETLGELYLRTHYGGCMPLLYGYPADLAYFVSHGMELHATIDRYLTVPLLHELCHFGRHREALPMHLDECVAGYLGVHVWPEFAYPEPGEDDAIYAAPWLSQVGQAIARAFGVPAVVRAHASIAPWASVLPRGFVAAAERLAWDDWCTRRTVHFLSDTLAPEPWVALALLAGAGEPLRGHTLESLARAPLDQLALREDVAFDRDIVEDALRAMCLDNVQLAGSFRARTRVPDAPIAIDARACSVTTPARSALDYRAPRYWLPPAVAARLTAAGIAGYTLRLADVRAIPEAAAAICDAARDCERDGFALVIR